MNARAWTSAVLVVLASGATAYAYFVDRDTVSDGEREARRSDIFPSFRLDDVRRVELRHDRELLVLERDSGDAGRWHIALPHRASADAGAVDALLRELELAKRLREVPANEAAGLDTPRVEGKLSFGRFEYAFALGGDAPRPEGAAYMRVDGEGAFVVDRSLAVQLLRGSDAYRDRALVSYSASEIAQLEVASPAGRFTLARKGATFRVGGPAGLRASRPAVDALLGALADARAETFLDDAEADRRTAGEVTTVVITAREGGAVQRLRAGGECPAQPGDVAVVREGAERVSACVSQAVVAALRGTAASLVDRSLFFAHADEIEELRLKGAGSSVEIARRAGGWRERAPEDRELAPDEVDSAGTLVADLAAATATEVRAPNGGERVATRVTASIVRTGGAAGETIELGPTGPDGFTTARRADVGAILRRSREVARRAEPHPVALHGRSLWPAPFDPRAVVSIDDTCPQSRERLESRDGRWALRDPRGLPADSEAATAFAQALAQAGADVWIAESDDGAFGFGRPGSCTVTLAIAPANLERPAQPTAAVGIVFGGEAPGGVYAHTLGEHAVFVAAPDLRAEAARPAIDAARLRIDPTAVTRVAVTRGGARVTLDAREDRLVRRAPGNDADGGEDGLGAALLAFRVRDAVHAGAPAPDEGFDRPTLEIEVVRSAAAGDERTIIVVGAAGHDAGADDYFARASGIDATFAVPRQCVDAVLAAW